MMKYQKFGISFLMLSFGLQPILETESEILP